jgi:CBS domain-containing protein/anti-sigma regulatory factor (Ser/Thr protein kinase)
MATKKITKEITRVQELIYTSKVEMVMATDVIVVEPSMSLAEANNLLKVEHVTAAPVVENGDLVGLISVSDVIEALEKGSLDSPVSKSMTRDLDTCLKDASVMEVVNRLGRKGHSRIPVVDREGKLVGIVTTGTIMRSLLRQMETSLKKKEAEKLHTYRASHIFGDIVSDDTSLVLRYIVDDKDFDKAGHASSMIKRSLQRLGVSPPIVRRVAAAVYEAEMNLVIHTEVGGEILVDIRRDKLKISTIDHGPGIDDVAKVLEPGYSTAPEWIRDMGFGAGMGLANIKRCADVMKLMSEPGYGTRLDIIFRFS